MRNILEIQRLLDRTMTIIKNDIKIDDMTKYLKKYNLNLYFENGYFCFERDRIPMIVLDFTCAEQLTDVVMLLEGVRTGCYIYAHYINPKIYDLFNIDYAGVVTDCKEHLDTLYTGIVNNELTTYEKIFINITGISRYKVLMYNAD